MPTNPQQRDIYTRGGVLDQVAALAWDQHRVEAGLPTFPRDIMTAEFLAQDEDLCEGFRSKVLPFVLRTLQADDATRPSLTLQDRQPPPVPYFESAVQEHIYRIRNIADQRIRMELIERGIDPDIVLEVARRAQAGEFDPMGGGQ